MKKIVSIFLTFVFAASISMTAFAATPDEPYSEKVLIEHEVETITDDEGNTYEIEMNRYRSMNSINTKAINPEHEVGYIDTFEFKVTNNQLGVVSVVGGAPVPKEVKKKIAELSRRMLCHIIELMIIVIAHCNNTMIGQCNQIAFTPYI